jgi:hypothetical protein
MELEAPSLNATAGGIALMDNLSHYPACLISRRYRRLLPFGHRIIRVFPGVEVAFKF